MPSVLVLLTDRANYGRLKPVMAAIRAHDELDLLTVCTGTMLLDRFKRPIDNVRADGFYVNGSFACELEGSTSYTQSKSAGVALSGFADQLESLKPDCVLLIGDRSETGGCVVAAHLANVPICHLQGGEVSGTRDHGTRNMITQLATWHVPATIGAAFHVGNMTTEAAPCIAVGCPSSDIAADITPVPHDYVLALYHPNTDHPETAHTEGEEFRRAILQIAKTHPVKLFWPNIDAGSNEISDAIRWIRHEDNIGVYQNVGPEEFMRLIADAACCVGNSSSFMRDSSFFGTPVVLVGDRQDGREHAENVHFSPCEAEAIVAKFREQVSCGHYPRSTLYGDGNVSQRIADGLTKVLCEQREEVAA